jgi:NAD(P)-dependent dehydrogenase (short-subunit alcohol dehydrogenase family)
MTPDVAPHAGRIALITGANRGLGREAAFRLAELGMHVLVGCRLPLRSSQRHTSARHARSTCSAW